MSQPRPGRQLVCRHLRAQPPSTARPNLSKSTFSVLGSCLPRKGGVSPWTCSGHQDPRARPCLHVPLQPCRASLSGLSASRRSFCWCCVLGGGLHLAHGQFAGPSSCFTCAAPGTAPKVVPASRLWHCVPSFGGMASHGPDGGDKLGAQSIRTSVSPCWPRRTRYASTYAPGAGNVRSGHHHDHHQESTLCI